MPSNTYNLQAISTTKDENIFTKVYIGSINLYYLKKIILRLYKFILKINDYLSKIIDF